MYKLILLDLDGTLINSKKAISPFTLETLEKCRDRGILIGVATARSELNAKRLVSMVNPDVLISNGGALARCLGEPVYTLMFSEDETATLVRAGVDAGREVTVDTPDATYWNYRVDPREMFPDWGTTLYTDYLNFHEVSFKVCIQTTDPEFAKQISDSIGGCDYVPFSDCDWYKFSKSGASKEKAIPALEKALGISREEIIAFGDDYVDIEMLKYCGRGVAMGNAIDEVKQVADDIAEDNDSDGVAKYLSSYI